MKLTKREIRKQKWIDDVQMFARIAGKEVPSKDSLSEEYELYNNKQRTFHVKNSETLSVISPASKLAAAQRNN